MFHSGLAVTVVDPRTVFVYAESGLAVVLRIFITFVFRNWLVLEAARRRLQQAERKPEQVQNDQRVESGPAHQQSPTVAWLFRHSCHLTMARLALSKYGVTVISTCALMFREW